MTRVNNANGNKTNTEAEKVIRLDPELREHGMVPENLELAVHRYNEIYGDGIFLSVDDMDCSKKAIYRYPNVDTLPFWNIVRSL